MLVDLWIRRIKSVYHTLVRARMATRLEHDECRTLQRREGLTLRYIRVHCNAWGTTSIVAISLYMRLMEDLSRCHSFHTRKLQLYKMI